MLSQAKNVYLVGIKGVAMANLAVILKKMGKEVAGSDLEEEFITDEVLKKNKISWQVGFDPKYIPVKTNLIVYSAAHQGNRNPQVIAAKGRDIQVISQAELLGELTKQFKTTIAVCGCHGKTTTSSLLSYALINLGVKPSYMIGSSYFDGFPGGDYNSNDYFVVEADEYGVNPPYDLKPKFHYLNPDYILCTNIDYDHPDVYKNLEEVKSAYFKFFAGKKLILCADDPSTLQLINQLKYNQFLSYGFTKRTNLRITNYRFDKDGSNFDLELSQKPLGTFIISLFGEKNISNAAGVILTLIQLGFSPDKVKNAIKNFTGPKRRFEFIYSDKNISLFDDYAHHPEEIQATIQAVKSHFPKKRIIVIFQPHTYSRTQALLKEFAGSLSLADNVFIMPIFPSARENPKDFKVTSADIEKISPKKIKSTPTKKALIQLLTSNLHPQSIVFTMGAGDVYKLKDDIIDIVSKIK